MLDLLPFDQLPVFYSPERPFLDPYTLIPYLMDLYPQWDENDIRAFAEEKTRGRLTPEDVTTIRAIYLRIHLSRQRWAEESLPRDV
jgi:hypothetical protein